MLCLCFRDSNSIIEYSTDDGEPKNSAGPHILGQIKSNQLENVLIAVVRYFGGTKLGVPGLINAYKTTAILTIEACVIVLKEDELTLKIEMSYSDYNHVLPILKYQEVHIKNEKHLTNCKLEVSVPTSKKEELLDRLNKFRDIIVEWQN